MKITVATRNGIEQYVIGRADRASGCNRPWTGKTHSPIPAQDGEVAAALVWDVEVNGYANSSTSRWSVIERDATSAEQKQLQ